MAGKSLAGLINPKSKAFRDLKVDPAQLDEAAALDLLQKYPRIMLRPVLTDGERVALTFDRKAMASLIPAQAG